MPYKLLSMQEKSGKPGPVSRPGVRKVRVDAEAAGQRVDNFLRKELPGVPKSRLYRLLRRGEVRINGGRVRADHRLQAGDEVRIPPARVREPGAEPGIEIAARLAERVLFEDQRLLVIDKPSGTAVHGGSGVSHGVIELLRFARPDLRDLSLVHRLDRETSGCLVLSKKRSALRVLHEQFREGLVEKNYLALVAGDWQLGEVLVEAPLLVQNRRGGERHVIVSDKGKRAATRFRLSRRYGDFSLMQCQPLSGRTHQVRVHAQHQGHPLVIDERYGDELANKAAQAAGLRRLFLHAQSISFPDDSGNDLHFTAPLAEDLQAFLTKIENRIGPGGRR
ncbi:MAG TPA: RluA family pseudouridine synthase [Woeseiaceae bacterium]